MVRFAHRDSGAAVYSDDEDALDYLELNSFGDTLVRLRRLTLVYDLALCKFAGMKSEKLRFVTMSL